eukprot:403343748
MSMDQETLEMHIELAVQSLYGKVGSADVIYQILKYSRKDSFMSIQTDQESAQRLYNSLMMNASSFDGQLAIRFQLIGMSKN